MAEDRRELLSAAHRETLRSALIAAFGHDQTDGIVPLTGGASGALPIRVETCGRNYLVRIEGPASPLRNPHQYDSMRIAADERIAPKLLHIDEAARVVVMDFVEERPLHAFPGGPRALAQSIGEMLGRLQGAPQFRQFVEYPDIVSRLFAWVGRTGLFESGALNQHSEHLARIRDVYTWHPTNLVSSHNDLVPRNVLFDGERIWLIDWESAYLNDPLVDVAIALDGFAPTPELENVLLKAWLGRAPDDALNRRLALVRALTRLYYAGVLLSASAAAFGALADGDLSAPTRSEFQRAIRDGRLKPGAPMTKHVLGKMYLASFLTGEVPPGLDAAV